VGEGGGEGTGRQGGDRGLISGRFRLKSGRERTWAHGWETYSRSGNHQVRRKKGRGGGEQWLGRGDISQAGMVPCGRGACTGKVP